MKKISFVFLILFNFSINQQLVGQSRLLKHYDSKISYEIGKCFIIINNEYCRDSAIKTAPGYFKSPYETRKIFLYGPTLRFTIGSKKAKLLAYVNKSNSDSFKLKGLLIDSTLLAIEKFDLHSLQIKVSRNQQIWQDWKNVLLLGEKSNPFLKKGYGFQMDSLSIGEHILISFRNSTQDNELLNFEFERVDPMPLRPFLASISHDSSANHFFTHFVEKELNNKREKTESIDNFYQYWPANGDFMLQNVHLYEHSKLALYFRKPSPDYPDASLEYNLSSYPIKDTVWLNCTHILFIPELKADKHYTLLVRYKANPDFIQKYTFYTDPLWYQTGLSKVLFASFFIILLLFISLFVYRSRMIKLRKKREQLSLEIKSIRSQLNPHFVFNALSSIQGLINKNEISEANHYLTEFSTLLRESLRNNDKEMVPLISEIKLLETYLKLEQLRFHFQYTITIEESINQNTVEIPSLLLQPLLENAVKHGTAQLLESGLITIQFSAENRTMHILISDNGSGFQGDGSEKGLGLKLTRDRIQLLNQTFKKQLIGIEFLHMPNNGTTVHLSFENWL